MKRYLKPVTSTEKLELQDMIAYSNGLGDDWLTKRSGDWSSFEYEDDEMEQSLW